MQSVAIRYGVSKCVITKHRCVPSADYILPYPHRGWWHYQLSNVGR